MEKFCREMLPKIKYEILLAILFKHILPLVLLTAPIPTMIDTFITDMISWEQGKKLRSVILSSAINAPLAGSCHLHRTFGTDSYIEKL